LLDWESDFERRIERINAVLEKTAGVKLRVVELVPWERSIAEPLGDVLAALEKRDSAEDVDWVLALTDAGAAGEKDMDNLGLAPPLSKYIVLRAGSAEATGHERDVVLLHHLAGSLGVPLDAGATSLRNREYAHERAAFSPAAAEFQRAMLKVRLGDHKSDEVRAALEELLAAEDSAFTKEERDAVLAKRSAAELQAAEELELNPDARPADREAFQTAMGFAERKNWVQAWEKLEPLLGFYPDDPAVLILACVVDQGQGSASAGKRCEAAQSVAGDRVEVMLAVARSRAKAEQVAQAAAALDELIAARRDSLSPAEWLGIGQVYQQISWVQAAEDAARQAGLSGRPLLDWASETRARYTLPLRQRSVPRDKEAAYIGAVKEGLKVIYSGNRAAGLAAIRDLARAFPKVAGAELLRCELALRQREYDTAERHCKAVIKADPRASWAHYLLGLLLNRKGKKDAAREKFQRAVDVDPSLKQAYKPLRELLEELGDKAALKELAERHKRRFGK